MRHYQLAIEFAKKAQSSQSVFGFSVSSLCSLCLTSSRFRSYSQYFFLLPLLFLFACSNTVASAPTSTPTSTAPQITIIAEGLIRPIGLAQLPDGSLLIAEAGSGQDDDSGGVSLIKLDGQVGRLISGLPSSLDAGDIAGVNLVGVSPGGDVIYVGNFGAGHLWTLALNDDKQQTLAIPTQPLTLEQLTTTMPPLNRVSLINPFDITFDAEGSPVVSDASGNGIATENPDGTTRFMHRFDKLPDPTTPETSVSIEAVPTGLDRIGDEYYVTLFGGCPYPAQSGQLVAIDEKRNQRTVVDQLNLPIDVAQGPDGTIWVLEFAVFEPGASCFDGQGYRSQTGRLSRLQPDGMLTTVMGGLNFPGAVLPVGENSVYLSEVFDGRVVRVDLVR